MVGIRCTAFGIMIIGLASTIAQTAASKSLVGTVSGFKAESAEIQVKPDDGDVLSLKVTTSTQVQRVPAGEKDLKKAEPIKITDVAAGDRVLVTLMPAAS